MKLKLALLLLGFFLGFMLVGVWDEFSETPEFLVWPIVLSVTGMGFGVGFLLDRRKFRRLKGFEYWPIIMLVLSLLIKGTSLLEDWHTRFPSAVGIGLLIGLTADYLNKRKAAKT